MYTTLHYGPADVADDGHGGGYDGQHLDEDILAHHLARLARE